MTWHKPDSTLADRPKVEGHASLENDIRGEEQGIPPRVSKVWDENKLKFFSPAPGAAPAD